MKTRLIALLVLFLSALQMFSNDLNTAFYSPTGQYTNSAGKAYYLGTTNVASAAVLDLVTAGSTEYIVPDEASYVDIHWSAKASGLLTPGTNILYMSVGQLNPQTGTVVYDTATNALNAISLTMTWKGEVNTNQVSQQFSVQGRKYLKPGCIVSTSGSGTSTNHLVYINARFKAK